jgi:hypothetical protein
MSKENNELLKNIFEKADLSIEEKNIIVNFYLHYYQMVTIFPYIQYIFQIFPFD